MTETTSGEYPVAMTFPGVTGVLMKMFIKSKQKIYFVKYKFLILYDVIDN